MARYIDRDSDVIGLHTEKVGEVTVRIRTRRVGTKIMVDTFEYAPLESKGISKTKLVTIVRKAVAPHMEKIGTPRVIADTTVEKRNVASMDVNGKWTESDFRIREITHIVGK
jgi:hypothetical protein